MKQLYGCLLVVSALGLGACGSSNTAEQSAAASPLAWDAAIRTAEKAQVKELISDWQRWYQYTYYQVRLSHYFTGLDTAAHPISRQAFLDQLATGRVIALRRKPGNATEPAIYKLAPFDNAADVANTSKQLANSELDYLRWEGKPLPAFAFQDLNGKAYTAANTLGKILVLKAWFINCHTCVQEFPQVNALVEKYRPNKDVLFVSLAFDGASELRDFLKQGQLKYATVPNCEPYLAEKLNISGYPTHIIVGRDGNIVKMVGTADDLALALAHELQPKSLAAN